MAPGGIEPPHVDSKSTALSTELRGLPGSHAIRRRKRSPTVSAAARLALARRAAAGGSTPARAARYPGWPRGGGSSVGRAPGCGPGGRGFESRPPPAFAPRMSRLSAGRREASSAHSTAARAVAAVSTPRAAIAQPSIQTTGTPVRRARAISLSVPALPPIPITASAQRTRSAFRISPSPVVSATATKGFASARSVPGRRPIVRPPAAAAPRHAASMTPPRPPQTRIAPASARREPVSSAAARHAASAASLGPATATIVRRLARSGSTTNDRRPS